MYYPSNMTFQYFFFDTYLGNFLQILPIALIVGIIYGWVKSRKDHNTPFRQRIGAVLFVCYITGLICLVWLFGVIGDLWYRILYHMDSGRNIGFFDLNLRANFVPDFFTHMDRERCANVILFLPFGILYPFYKQDASWKRTVWAGSVFSLIIEIMQPLFDRAFDINDIILNIIGVLISATAFYIIKRVVKNE